MRTNTTPTGPVHFDLTRSMQAPTDDPRVHALVVDDDPVFRKYMAKGLEAGGLTVTLAEDGEQALALLGSGRGLPVDVVLLDVMMPVRTGWDCLTELRARGREVPVIFVSARETTEDRIHGLELGADDYVSKPFSLRELIARVNSVVGRRRAMPRIEHGPLRIDLGLRRVWYQERELGCARLEFELLATLVRASGATVSREVLLSEVWNMNFDPGTNVVDVAVGRLRRKLGREGSRLIRSVYGKGYCFVPPE
ncbi:MAG: response regulator transcription factor [Planctomycetota bacterium]|nr:response regulator transcription factor [Planctomycetota bacterium]